MKEYIYLLHESDDIESEGCYQQAYGIPDYMYYEVVKTPCRRECYEVQVFIAGIGIGLAGLLILKLAIHTAKKLKDIIRFYRRSKLEASGFTMLDRALKFQSPRDRGRHRRY